jgi:hypothetical protein
MTVLRKSLVNPEKNSRTILHIKLSLMKQFVEALDGKGSCFDYLSNKFPALAEAKVEGGIFVGQHIKIFEESMTTTEREAWFAFKEVINKFLGNNKDTNYEKFVNNTLEKYKVLVCEMGLKRHLLFSHYNQFPENLRAFSEQ